LLYFVIYMLHIFLKVFRGVADIVSKKLING